MTLLIGVYCCQVMHRLNTHCSLLRTQALRGFNRYIQEHRMKNLIGQLYNGFLLRDLLGYVVPGAFVLACFIHLLSFVTKTPIEQIFQSIPNKSLAQFFIVCLCYICGHFLSGVFFHLRIFKWIFSYSPKALRTDYPNISQEQAWSTHRADYRKACEIMGESMQSHIERHAALLHFTGHISSSFLFTFFYLSSFATCTSSYNILAYTAPIVVLFPGVFSHYRRLCIERYSLERAAIKRAVVEKDNSKLIV